MISSLIHLQYKREIVHFSKALFPFLFLRLLTFNRVSSFLFQIQQVKRRPIHTQT